MKNGKWLIGLSVWATALAGTDAAFAQAGSDSSGGSAQGTAQEGQTAQPAAAPPATESKEPEAKPAETPAVKAEASAETSVGDHPPPTDPGPEAAKAESETKLDLGLEMVVGFGKVPFAVAQDPGSLQTRSTYLPETVKASTESIIVGAAYHITPQLAVGLRIPFTFGAFDPPQSMRTLGGRSTVAMGNIELEGRYELRFSEQLKLTAALAVTLPTAGGDNAMPDAATLRAESLATNIDRTPLDRFSTNRAAALARGYEENPLFLADRLGVLPKLALEYKSGPLSITPYVKLHNLIGTSSSLEHSYLGEVVPGLRAGYYFHKNFEGAVRVWANAQFAGSTDSDKVSAAVEPQILGHFGTVTPVVGVILPFVGAPVDPYNFGVRIGISGSL